MKRGDNLRKYDHSGPTYKTRPIEYSVWSGMRSRCNNRNSQDFRLYGGRGIKVCAQWNEFSNFYVDMGPRPTAGHQIDRINSNGDYEPSNCKWSTPEEQTRNMSRNRWLTHNGVTMILQDWATKLEIDNVTLRERLERWGAEKALSTPAIRIRDRGSDGRYA